MELWIQALLKQHPDVESVKVVKQEDNQHFKVTVVPRTSSSATIHKQRVQADLAEDGELYLLPNGYRIAHQSPLQTNIIYPEIFNAEMYLRHGVTLSPGACVFDVGANIGLFTLFAYEKCQGNIQVYAFEPVPPTFDVLKKNVRILGMQDQVKAFCCGLSSSSTTVPLVFFPYMSGMSGRFSNAAIDKQVFIRGICSWLQEGEHEYEVIQFKRQLYDILDAAFSRSETYQCQFTTLSQVIKEDHIECIDLLKIDVERCELDVLLGVEEQNWKKIRQITAEVHSEFLLHQITGLLVRNGYRVVIEEEGTDQKTELASDSDIDYKLYMIYAVRHTDDKHGATSPAISYITTRKPLLSMKELYKFLQAEVTNYVLLSQLRHLLKNTLPEMLPYVEFDLVPSLENAETESHSGDLIAAAN